jgi:hypothetical protein
MTTTNNRRESMKRIALCLGLTALVVIGKVKSLAQAKDFTNSPSLKETMKKVGVISPPDIAFLKVVEQKTY